MSDEKPYLAFGDESCGPDVVTYAFAIFERSKLPAAEDAIALIKAQFGGKSESKLHCRELFSGNSRAKGPWSHLGLSEVIALYNAVLDVVIPSLHGAALGYALKSEMPAEIGTLDDNDAVSPMPGQKGDGTMTIGDKEIARICAHGSMIPIIAALGEANVEVYAAPDRSKIRSFDRTEQFDRTIRGFVEHAGAARRFNASTNPNTTVMFEIADCFAYFPQKTIMICDPPSFVETSVRSLRDRISYNRARLTFPDGKLAVHIEN